MNSNTDSVQRVIGFGSHPDSFTAAILRGPTPAAAIVEKVFNQIPMPQLSAWAKKHTAPADLFVLEASGNSFQVVRALAAAQEIEPRVAIKLSKIITAVGPEALRELGHTRKTLREKTRATLRTSAFTSSTHPSNAPPERSNGEF